MNRKLKEPDHIPPYQLALLFLVALLPRITGLITYVNEDENFSAQVRVLTGDLSGGTSQTLPLINYLCSASFVALYAIGRLVGVWHTTADFRAQYFVDRTPFVFAGRFVAACLGALSAPMAALIASRLGLTRRSSLIVGVMVAILPLNIWVSHFAKPDSGVAFAVLLVTWSLLRKLDIPESRWSDIMVGVGLAIAMSFKQTALFVIAPALVGFVALLRWHCRLPWSQIACGLLVGLLSCVVVWVPMNIGILLDIRAFLSFQRATVRVMSRDATVYQIAEHNVPMLLGNITGLTAAGMMAWLFAPFVRRDRPFLMLWGSVGFAYVAFLAISGGVKVQPRYLIPYDQLAFTLGCIAALSLVEWQGRWSIIGGLLTAAVLASEGVGSVEIVKQAMMTPMPSRCSEVLQKIVRPDRDRILSQNYYLVGVPIATEALDEERRRHERLAKKYSVEIGDRPEEKKSHRYEPTRGFYVRQIPWAFGGMEDLNPKVAENAIMPFWWPIQEEEWELDYWTSQGFNIFVVLDEESPGITTVPAYRNLHRQIKERCEQMAVLPSQRSRFGEGELRVYRLPDRR